MHRCSSEQLWVCVCVCFYPSVTAVVIPAQAICAGLDLKLSNPVICWRAALNDDPGDLLQLTHIHLNPGVCWNTQCEFERQGGDAKDLYLKPYYGWFRRQTGSRGHPAWVPIQTTFIRLFSTERWWCREHWISDVSILHTQPSQTHWKHTESSRSSTATFTTALEILLPLKVFLPLHLNLFLIGMMFCKKQTVTSSISNISFIHIQVLSHRSARSWKPPPGIWRRSGRGQCQSVRTGNRILCYRSYSWPKPAFPQQCTHLKDHQYVRNPVRKIETYWFILLVLWVTRGSVSIWADLVTAASVKSRLDVDDAVLGAVKDQAGVLTGVYSVET